MASSYTVKNIRATFTLTNSNAVFPGTNSNVLQVSGLRMSAVVKQSGIPAFPEATLRIYGMRQADMNALARVQTDSGKPQYTRNTVQIEADSGSGFVYIFSGQIIQAGPEYSESPDVYLMVHGQNGGYEQLTPAQPTAFPGVAQWSDIIGSIASKLSFTFENDGVTGSTTNAYFSGTLMSQLRQAVRAAGAYLAVDPGQTSSIIITPAGMARTTIQPFLLTPQSGLVGYPQVLGNGYLNVRSVFNPSLRLLAPLTIQGSDVVIDQNIGTQAGTQATLNSSANGNWAVGPLVHTIECQKPGGAWFTDMKLWPPGALPAVQS
jgi:hypothetical protein